jgi:hypothetical protein
MPQAHVADDQTSLREQQLNARGDLPACLQQIRLDLLVLILRTKNVLGRICVATEPDLCGTILLQGCNQIDVDRVCPGDLGEIKININMDGLSVRGFKGSVGAIEAQQGPWA